MRLPSKAILIRIAIFGPLIVFFGVRACVRYQEQSRAQAGQAARADEAAGDLPAAKRSVRLPDGSEMPVLELTEDEFEERFGKKPPPEAMRGDADDVQAAIDAAAAEPPEPDAVDALEQARQREDEQRDGVVDPRDQSAVNPRFRDPGSPQQ